MRIRWQILALVAVLLTGVRAEGRDQVFVTLESLTIESQAVVVAKAAKLEETPDPYHGYLIVHFEVQNVIKGTLDGNSVKVYLPLVYKSTFAAWVAKPEEQLLFLAAAGEGSGMPKGSWTVRDHQRGILTLSAPGEQVNRKGEFVEGKDAVVALVKDWASSKVSHTLDLRASGSDWTESDPNGNVIPHLMPWVLIPEASSMKLGWPSTYLIVPAEEKYRQPLMNAAKSPYPYERTQAATELYKYPGDQTVALLREMLKDSSEVVWKYSEDSIAHIEYGVRSAACASLKQMGQKVPDLTLERTPTAQEQKAARELAWRKSFREAMPKEWGIAVADGEIRKSPDGQEYAAVFVSLTNGKKTCKITLIPNHWPKADSPGGEYLGTNGHDSQGARRFYAETDVPADAKARVVRYFGLTD